jgi:Uncharacterized protein conserved in bacteria (DUF2188)
LLLAHKFYQEVENMANKKPPIHVVPHKDGWAVEREGSKRPLAVKPTQAGAEQVGRPIARDDKTEFNLHGRDGKIRQKDSYGSDPNPPKDKDN